MLPMKSLESVTSWAKASEFLQLSMIVFGMHLIRILYE